MSSAEVVARVCASLPPRSARVLIRGGAVWDDAVRAAGHAVVTPPAGADVPDASVDAAVFESPAGDLPAGALAALHAALVDRGSLIVVAPAVARWALVVALSEAAFALLSVEAEGGEVILHGRRDRFVVRSYRDGDAPAILDLFHRVFHPHRSLDHLRWKYLEAPYGNRRISLACDGDGKLVAHYAGYTVPLHDALANPPREVLALHVGDTMTAPEARSFGRGETSLLGRTVRHFYAAHCEEQVAFNYGFNRGNIQKFSLRFVRAERAEDVGYRVREATQPLRPPSRLRRSLGRLAVEEVASGAAVGAEWDEFFRRAAPGYGVLVRRDASYVKWRYLSCPDATYRLFAVRRAGRLVGWGVFKQEGDALTWGDALFDRTAGAGVRLLVAAAISATGAGGRRIQGWFPDRPLWWVAELERLGLRRVQEPRELALMMVPFTDPDATASVAPRLYYTQGDSDLF